MESETKIEAIGNSTLYQYIASIMNVLSGLVFYVYIARVLSETIVGSVALLLSLSSLFSIIFSLGLGGASRHFLSYQLGKDGGTGSSRILRLFLTFGIILSVASFLAVYLLSSILSLELFRSTSYSFPIDLLGIAVSIGIMDGIVLGILLGIQRFKLNAIVLTLQSLSTYFLPVMFYFISPSIYSFIFGWILSGSIVLVTGLAFALKGIPYSRGIDGPDLRTVMNYALPVYLSSVVGVGSMYVDRIAVAYFMPLSEIAIYNFAILFYSSIGFLVTPINHVLMPKVSEKFAAGDSEQVRSMGSLAVTLVSIIYVPAALGMAAISSDLLGFLGGPGYEVGNVPLSVMLFAGAISVPANVFLQTLSGTRNTSPLLKASIMALVANFAISILLIPRFGILGAGIAYSSVGLVTLFTYVHYTRRVGIFSFNLVAQGKIFFSAIFMYAVISISMHYFDLSEAGIPVYIIEGAAIFLILMKLLKPLGIDQVQVIKTSLTGHLSLILRIMEFLS